MTKLQRILLSLIQASMVALALALFIYNIINPEFNKTGGTIASLLLPFLPNVIERLFKTKVSFRLQLTYFMFLFIALFLGIDFSWYKNVPFFDKIVHLASGALSVIVAWYALLFFKAAHATTKSFQAVFIICFCVSIAVAWEFFEFTCDKLLGQSMQQLVSIGVDDTMYDLLMALVGASVGTIILLGNTKSVEKFSIEKHRK